MSSEKNWMALVDTFVDPDGSETSQAESCEAIGKLLLEKKISTQDVVTGIGKYLTATDNAIRARGLILLGELLVKLKLTPLEDTTVHSLTQFFTAKLEDWHCIRGALIGSIALLQRTPKVGAVQGSDTKDMTKSALEHLHVQALGLNDRLLSLELLECCVTTHGASISPLGDDLVYGICKAIEEEKDPRCLLVAFRLVENLAKLFPDPKGPLVDTAEDLFDIVSRYFPVSFTPAPNDKRGISRDDLAAALLRVFTSTPLFAPFCIPLLLEKLSSSLQKAKLDSLKYLGVCTESFGPQSLLEYPAAIWQALKAELLPPSVRALATSTEDQKDVQVYDEALSCLTQCVGAFQKGMEGNAKVPAAGELVKLICEDECIGDLLKSVENDNARVSDGTHVDKKPGSSVRAKQQSWAIGDMFAAAVRACPSSSYILTSKFLKLLILAAGVPALETPETPETPSPDKTFALKSHVVPQKHLLSISGLEVITQILEAASSVAQSMALSSKSAQSISKIWLEPIFSVIPMLLMTFRQITMGQVLTEEQSKLGVAGLQALASFPAAVSPLSENELQSLLLTLVKTFLDKTRDADLKKRALGAILAVSNLEDQFSSSNDKNEFSVMNIVTPSLLEAVEQAETIESLNPPLQALATLAGPRQTAREATLNGLRQIVGMNFSQALVEDGCNFTSVKVVRILENLSQEIIPRCEKGSTDQMAACHIILDTWSAVADHNQTGHQISEEVLSSLIAANRVTVRSCTETVQKEILSKATSILLNGNSETLPDKILLSQEGKQDWASIDISHVTEEKGWLVALVASVVVGLLPGLVSPSREVLLKIFVTCSILKARPLITTTAAQATASLLNKWKATSPGDTAENCLTLDLAIKEAIDKKLMPLINQYMSTTASYDDKVIPLINQNTGTNASNADESSCCGLDQDNIVRGVAALAWTGKGLAMRGHTRVSDVAGLLLSVLQTEGSKCITTESDCQSPVRAEGIKDAKVVPSLDQHGSPIPSSCVAMSAAEGLGIIVKDNSVCLDKVHNAIMKPLFKQRFFNSMLPPLQEGVRIAGNRSYRIWFFRAFGHILAGIPNGAALTEGQKVYPLLLEGLSTLCLSPDDSELLLSTLLTLSAFLTDENNGRTIAAEHVPATVKRLTNLVQYRASLVVRETALQCLAAIVGLPFTRVFPMKQQVMKAIIAALDDHKRIVRKEAVRCRRVWSAISYT